MFLRILEEGMRLDEVVTIDLGDDFPVIYDTLLFVASVCIRENIKIYCFDNTGDGRVR